MKGAAGVKSLRKAAAKRLAAATAASVTAFTQGDQLMTAGLGSRRKRCAYMRTGNSNRVGDLLQSSGGSSWPAKKLVLGLTVDLMLGRGGGGGRGGAVHLSYVC